MKTLITAHSGADGTADNSREYLAYILGTQVDAAEIDVREVDGALVLTHDPVAGTSTGSGTALVTLQEAFEMLKDAPEAMRYNCDLKEDGLEGKVYALAKDCGVADRILYSGSVSVERMRDAGILEKVEVYLNIEEIVPEDTSSVACGATFPSRGRLREIAERACAIAKDAGIGVLNVNKLLVTEEFFQIYKDAGIGLSVWTVDAGEEAARFLAMGVHSVTTREVAKVMEMRALNRIL